MKTLTIEVEKNSPIPKSRKWHLEDGSGTEYLSISTVFKYQSTAILLTYYNNAPIELLSPRTFKERLASTEQPENQEFPLHIKYENYENILFFCNNEDRTRRIWQIMDLFNNFKLNYTLY